MRGERWWAGFYYPPAREGKTTVKVKITVELRNGALRGNTITKTIEIPEEDLDGYDETTREQVVSETVDDVVTSDLVNWDWEEVK